MKTLIFNQKWNNSVVVDEMTAFRMIIKDSMRIRTIAMTSASVTKGRTPAIRSIGMSRTMCLSRCRARSSLLISNRNMIPWMKTSAVDDDDAGERMMNRTVPVCDGKKCRIDTRWSNKLYSALKIQVQCFSGILRSIDSISSSKLRFVVSRSVRRMSSCLFNVQNVSTSASKS